MASNKHQLLIPYVLSFLGYSGARGLLYFPFPQPLMWISDNIFMLLGIPTCGALSYVQIILQSCVISGSSFIYEIPAMWISLLILHNTIRFSTRSFSSYRATRLRILSAVAVVSIAWVVFGAAWGGINRACGYLDEYWFRLVRMLISACHLGGGTARSVSSFFASVAYLLPHCASVVLFYFLTRESSASRAGRCDHCGYDLFGILENRCPECGKPCD